MNNKDPNKQRSAVSLISLFTSFLRLGATSFGGPAMVAYIRKMAVEQKHWLDEESFRDGVALCQTIPGATAMQASAYVGLRVRGVAGALASFTGFGLPAFIIMMTLSALYIRMYSLPTVISAFNGLQAIIVAIVANATVSFGRTYLKKWRDLIIAVITTGMLGFGVNPIMVILLAALLGLMLYNRQTLFQQTIDSGSKYCFLKPVLLISTIAAIGFIVLFFVHRELFDLAIIMFKIDLFAFGGGFASIPIMFHEIVDVHFWMNGPTFLNGIALGQITPGPIVITATFVGYLLYGPVGGAVTTISVFLPSFLIIVGITPYFDRLRSSSYFNKAIGGILCSFVGLLLSVTIRFASNILWDFIHIILTGAAFIALIFKVDILWVVLIGTIISVVIL